MDYFEHRLRERFPRTDIESGDMAVTVTFSDGHEIQLLPAIRSSRGFRVAASNGEEWSNVVSPKRFAKHLTSVNQSQGGKVVPVIKLYKAINDSLPKSQRLTGYHIEALAVEAFRQYDGHRTLKSMLSHLFKHARTRVLRPTKEETGQSDYVDSHLGGANSAKRRRREQAITNLQRKIDKADALHSLETWEDMIFS